MKKTCLTVLLLSTLAQAAPPSLADDFEDNRRTERFISTFLGGASLLVAPIAIGYAAAPTPTTCFGFRCANELPQALGTVAGVGAFTVGASVPFTLMGGRAGAGFSYLGGAAGFATGLVLLSIITAAAHEPWMQRMPIAGTGLLLGLTSFGSALGLDLRDQAVRAGAVPWSAGRAWLTGLAFWLPLAGFGTITALVTSLVPYGPAQLGTGVGFSAISVAGAAAIGFAVHRALKGRASWAAMALGIIGGVAAGALMGTLIYLAPPSSAPTTGGEMLYPLIGVGVTLMLAGPSVATEWSSAANSPPPSSHNDEPTDPYAPSSSKSRAPALELFPAGFGVAGRF